ncbi:MAG: hypothetical protein NZL99_00100 [Burkholderiaceae bacterium]|nr:hypothetical protein [Burkholderiaceae bacterium]MCX8005893.1 hypothetical protein [Burkholderiaceae bacterium]
MIFLIEYQRSQGRQLRFERFEDAQREHAQRRRFELESAHRGDDDYEVVLLEAENEEGLRRTHARYFGQLTA